MEYAMFAPLPTKMEKLEAVLLQIDAVTVQAPPPFVEIGKKLRMAYEHHRAQDYQLLSKSEWRQLPYALWVKGMPGLYKTDPGLLTRYWSEVLPEALQSSPRRAKRWLMPLFFVYCNAFDSESIAFQSFSAKLRQVLLLAQGSVAAKLREMDERQDFFNPVHAPSNLASLFFTLHQAREDELMGAYLFWPGFEGTKLGMAILRAGLQLSLDRLRELATVQRVMRWLQNMPAPVVKTDLRIAFADGLLLPWQRDRKMQDGLKKLLQDFFLQHYGDPRFLRHAHYQWEGVKPEAVNVMFYLLTGDTLKGFMRILDRTADDIWLFRQKFWMAYYDAGHIEEAWMVLGAHAQIAAQSNNATAVPQRFGRLEGGVSPNQSVLLLRIGDLVFSEWSHSGSLRAYREDDSGAPSFYQLTYHGQTLREAQSLDFHDGLNMRPELRHTHSEYGTWQRKARDMIRQRTGIYLSDREILL
ncbi:hypothetical protein J8G26_11640 [Acidovorax sp. JG5]|uniref:EH signature domain-containing protein n=1 Tax=Acidovorax sp. JG5 TaxID=2822718 RepID=UPI001B321C08|nr:EH signature domain-containing protein [Acidovorax sp. JG5]MBP3981381.1 hypothetical protein [Acidovorax sp. JG5]